MLPKAIIYKDHRHSLLIRPLEEKDAKDIVLAIKVSKENLLPFMEWAHKEFSFEGEIRNYFAEATLEMINNGYVSERSCLKYALIKEDRKDLPWYKEMSKKMTIIYS
jgi:hypothetical protein